MTVKTVNINILGKLYPISCADGQEEHLTDLSKKIDSRLRDLPVSSGLNNDILKLIVTLLKLEDDVQNVHNEKEALLDKIDSMNLKSSKKSESKEEIYARANVALSQSIIGISEYIDGVVDGLEEA
jgi:cell division protein ZapA